MTNLLFDVSVKKLNEHLNINPMESIECLSSSEMSDTDRMMLFISNNAKKCKLNNGCTRYFIQNTTENQVISESGNLIANINPGDITVYSDYIIVINGNNSSDTRYLELSKGPQYSSSETLQNNEMSFYEDRFSTKLLSIYDADGTVIVDSIKVKTFQLFSNKTIEIFSKTSGTLILIHKSKGIKVISNITRAWFTGPKLLAIRYKTGELNYITEDLEIKNNIGLKDYYIASECNLINSDKYIEETSNLLNKIRSKYPNLLNSAYNKRLEKHNIKVAVTNQGLSETYLLDENNNLHYRLSSIKELVNCNKIIENSILLSSIYLYFLKHNIIKCHNSMSNIHEFQYNVLKNKGDTELTFFTTFELIDTTIDSVIGKYLALFNPVGICTMVKLEESDNVFYRF